LHSGSEPPPGSQPRISTLPSQVNPAECQLPLHSGLPGTLQTPGSETVYQAISAAAAPRGRTGA
jgi:hypothetical protein